MGKHASGNARRTADPRFTAAQVPISMPSISDRYAPPLTGLDASPLEVVKMRMGQLEIFSDSLITKSYLFLFSEPFRKASATCNDGNEQPKRAGYAEHIQTGKIRRDNREVKNITVEIRDPRTA